MNARGCLYFIAFIGVFLSGMGHFIAGPAIMVLALIYRQRIVLPEERRLSTDRGERDDG